MEIEEGTLLKKYFAVIFTVILFAVLSPVTAYAAAAVMPGGSEQYDKDNEEQDAATAAGGRAISVGQASAEKDGGQKTLQASVIVLAAGTAIVFVIGTFIAITYLRREGRGSKRYKVVRSNAKATPSEKYRGRDYDRDREAGYDEEYAVEEYDVDTEYGGNGEYDVDAEYGGNVGYTVDAEYGGSGGYIIDAEYDGNGGYDVDAEYGGNGGYTVDAEYDGNGEYITDTEYDWGTEYDKNAEYDVNTESGECTENDARLRIDGNAESEPGRDHEMEGKSRPRKMRETRKQKRACRKRETAEKETYSNGEADFHEEAGVKGKTESGEEAGVDGKTDPNEETGFAGEEREVPVIKVDNVTMKFKVADGSTSGLKDYMIQKLKKQITTRDLLALDSVSFEVFKGEVVGVIGTNGSGKSTLLKIVSGAMKPTGGQVIVDKSKIQLLTLGTGFDMELTARENVYLNGAIIGYSRAFIDEHYGEIVAFAELEGFMDTKVKNFSSGMVSRLGFAIATVGDVAEILILDEVLSVGDEFFRKKSLRRIKEMIHGGSTVIMVSHGMGTIRENCTKVVWIEKGVLQMVGDAKTVCRAYQKMEKSAAGDR